MSRYNIRFEKGNRFWNCYIYDRKREMDFSGFGDTKEDAKNDAWDKVYSGKDDSYMNSSDKPEKLGLYLMIIAFPLSGGFFGALIAGILVIIQWFYFAYSFEEMISVMKTWCYYGGISGIIFGFLGGLYAKYKEN